jgi:hypothetical protein
MAPSYSSASPSNNRKAKVDLQKLADNCVLLHSTIRPIYDPFNNYCQCCNQANGDGMFCEAEVFCEEGRTKQKLKVCMMCLDKYNQIINFVPRLWVGDRLDSAEDSILMACRSAVIAAAAKAIKSDSSWNIDDMSLLDLDFYTIVRDLFQKDANVQYYLNNDSAAIVPIIISNIKTIITVIVDLKYIRYDVI